MNKKIFLWTILLVAIAGALAVIIFRGNMFSKEILRLEILGPEIVKMGEEIEYTVKYKNNGNSVLENPQLIFDMPDNSLTEDGRTRIIQDLNDIYPGDEQLVKIKTRLLGKEGDLKTAKVSLSYIPKNLTARYESETTFTSEIESGAITLEFDLPSKVEKSKDLEFTINYFSNIDYPLENLSLKVDFSDGFDFVSSSPSSLDNLEWKLQTINKAEGGRINIKGRIIGDPNQKLNFIATLGMWKGGKFIVIKESEVEVEIIQPLLFVSQQVNGSSSYIASPGEVLNYKISFRNIGSSSFKNLFMIVRLDGSALDMSTIQAQGGEVQSNDNMIVWDHNQNLQLRNLRVQDEGEVNFSVKVKNEWSGGSDSSNIVISNEVNISQIIKKFTIKVNSGLLISQKAYYKDFNIPNSGPTPPRVGQITTYTVNWDIKNYFSDAKNVKVKAVLPQNVSLTGVIMPQDEISNFSFDSQSREIVWSAGDILAGVGVNGDPISLSFQISLSPSDFQKGSAALLIGRAQISGENQFTGTIIIATDDGLSTSLPDDIANSGGGLVQ